MCYIFSLSLLPAFASLAGTSSVSLFARCLPLSVCPRSCAFLALGMPHQDTGRHAGELADLIWKLRLKFSMKDLSPARHILGMKISRNRNWRQCFLSQTEYIGRVLESFNMQSAKSASTSLPINLRPSQRDCRISGTEKEDMKSVSYAQAVGSFIYVMVVTRRHIAHAVGVVSKFMHNPCRSH